MDYKLKKNHLQQTNHIQLDTKKCKACWECIEVCRAKVIGKINLPWHKHIRLADREECTGCLRCIKACDFGAIIKLGNN